MRVRRKDYAAAADAVPTRISYPGRLPQQRRHRPSCHCPHDVLSDVAVADAIDVAAAAGNDVDVVQIPSQCRPNSFWCWPVYAADAAGPSPRSQWSGI